MLVCVYFHILINFSSLLSILGLCVLIGVNLIISIWVNQESRKKLELNDMMNEYHLNRDSVTYGLWVNPFWGG